LAPKSAFFFIKKTTGTDRGRPRAVKSCIGKLTITEKQAEKLGLKKSTRFSPLFEKCCLRQLANISYERTAQEIAFQTGVNIGHTCLHRLVQQQEWSAPVAANALEEVSVDGGKVRLRGLNGEGTRWLDYKAVRFQSSYYAAFFQDNNALVDYVNRQPLSKVLTCLGDGHDGIWNIIRQFNPGGERREILDWYHLVENLCKVGGSVKRLAQGKEFLWKGQVDETISLFKGCRLKQAQNFSAYLEKHSARIVNYEELSKEKVCSIGSGAVESAVKQIDRRLKISGSQWLMENVNQMLKLRCAYLNDLLSV